MEMHFIKCNKHRKFTRRLFSMKCSHEHLFKFNVLSLTYSFYSQFHLRHVDTQQTSTVCGSMDAIGYETDGKKLHLLRIVLNAYIA